MPKVNELAISLAALEHVDDGSIASGPGLVDEGSLYLASCTEGGAATYACYRTGVANLDPGAATVRASHSSADFIGHQPKRA